MKAGGVRFDPMSGDGWLVHRGESPSSVHRLGPVVLGTFGVAAMPRRRPAARVRASIDGVEVVRLEERTPISNQGATSSCWANAGCDALELLMPDPVQLSRFDLYWKARRMHGDECNDAGTYGRAIVAAMRDLGVCREETWPFDGLAADNPRARVNVRPPIIAAQEAYDHRIAGVLKIESRNAARAIDVRRAIDDGYPVMFSGPVGQSFIDYFGGPGPDIVWGPPVRDVGGHAMIAVGYRERAGALDFLVRNSWGLGGLGDIPGHAWFSTSYLSIAYEVYVPTQTVEI